MAKKRNNEVKRLQQEIEALQHTLAQHKQCVDVIQRTVNDMLEHTHGEIAALKWESDAQFTEAMIQLSAIKRTLSIVNLMIRTAVENWLKGE